MYDKQPVKIRIMEMEPGGIATFGFDEIAEMYFLAILKAVRNETGRKYTMTRNKGENTVTVVRLS